mmetsp:Transcript_42919/g.93628  ORF Transcript_42919/g.93628 Transcript_42919/m.93628 type:complete len:205 (-) Transcript_42919:740-1354(-)
MLTTPVAMSKGRSAGCRRQDIRCLDALGHDFVLMSTVSITCPPFLTNRWHSSRLIPSEITTRSHQHVALPPSATSSCHPMLVSLTHISLAYSSGHPCCSMSTRTKPSVRLSSVRRRRSISCTRMPIRLGDMQPSGPHMLWLATAHSDALSGSFSKAGPSSTLAIVSAKLVRSCADAAFHLCGFMSPRQREPNRKPSVVTTGAPA